MSTPPNPATVVEAARTGGEKATALLASAEASFALALARAPDNLAVVTRLGALQERRDDYVGALRTYLTFAQRWGARVFEIRYRIAADLGMSDDWIDQIASADFDGESFVRTLSSQRGERSGQESFCLQPGSVQILNRLIASPVPESLHAGLLEAAAAEWSALGRFLGVPRSTWRLIVAFFVSKPQYNDTSYQARFVRPSRARRERRQMVRLASLATETQRLAPWPKPFELGIHRLQRLEVRHRAINSGGTSPPVEYTRACVLARIYEISGDRRDADSALAVLQDVMQTGSTETWIATIANDPDLAPLRRTARFREWWHQLSRIEAPSPIAWIEELCAELAHRWIRYAALSKIAGPVAAPLVTLQRDAECHSYLKLACDGSLPDTQRRQATWRLVASAADLHVRIEAPTDTNDYLQVIRSERIVGAPGDTTGPITLAKLLAKSDIDPVAANLEARAKRWQDMGAAVCAFAHAANVTKPKTPH